MTLLTASSGTYHSRQSLLDVLQSYSPQVQLSQGPGRLHVAAPLRHSCTTLRPAEKLDPANSHRTKKNIRKKNIYLDNLLVIKYEYIYIGG